MLEISQLGKRVASARRDVGRARAVEARRGSETLGREGRRKWRVDAIERAG
jgi:hypothetical protein